MARITISDGSTSKVVDLTDATTVAGRAPENKIVIEDKQASRRHFSIDKTDYGYKVVDLESRNGTRVNDRQVNQALLRPGDRIQVGKHVLTFEDPNFKEPPADVVAKLAPSAQPPVRVEAPSSNPEASPGALPVAVEVTQQAGAPAPAPLPSDPPITQRRNRSGHTTAVQKGFQTQLKEEQKTLTMVAVGAGIFICVIVILIVIPPGSSPSTDPSGSKATTKAAPGLSDADKEEKEAHEFEELVRFCDRNRSSYAEIVSKVDQFKVKYPRTPNIAKLDEYRSAALNGQKTSRNAEFSEAERIAQEDLKKNDFAGGMKKIRELLAKYKNDVDIYERLIKLKQQADEDANSFFKAKCLEADAMKFSRKDEAREVYQSILKAFGGGSVPELETYCKIARTSLEGLQ